MIPLPAGFEVDILRNQEDEEEAEKKAQAQARSDGEEACSTAVTAKDGHGDGLGALPSIGSSAASKVDTLSKTHHSLSSTIRRVSSVEEASATQR